jgi:hypothetical protein
LKHFSSDSLLFLFFLLVVTLIGLIIKHYEGLFLRSVSDGDGLLVFVERNFAYDLVKTNGGLFIFDVFIELILGWFLSYEILIVEKLFGVFPGLSPHFGHINRV